MSDPINFEIEELVARYELHPHRQDVFVEGEPDRGLIRVFLQHHGHPDTAVFSISTVNVPAHRLIARQLLHPSRRSEVIVLAMELEEQRVSPSQVACIADADFEYLLPSGIKCSLLLFTDYASMELYAFSEDAINKVLIIVAPKTSLTGAALLGMLAGPLQLLFSAAAVNFDLQLGLAWIEHIDKFFAAQHGNVLFDEAEFMKRYLIDRLPTERVEQFKTRLAEIQSLLSSDIRCRIRGHDFIRIFTWFLRTVEKCKRLNEDSVRQMLYVAITPGELLAQPTFSSLQKRLTR